MKTLFTFILTISFLQLIAQPTINASWAPGIGDQVVDVVGTNANSLNEGNSGANAVWDYSGVAQDPNVPVAGFEYADPAVSSFASIFPDATIAVVVSGTDPNTLPTTFYKASNDQFELLGNALPMTSLVYSDPQVLMQFPFSFGDSFQDDFAATLDALGIMSFLSGDVVVTADAHGTITTPKGTFNNVIRIKTEMNRTDSIDFAPGSYSLVKETIVTYSWYGNTIGNNIANLSITNGETITVTAGTVFTDEIPETRAFSWNDTSGPNSLEEINGTLPFEINNFGPNPVDNNFRINIASEINGQVEMEIINHLGQIINRQTSTMFSGTNELEVSMENMPSGNYFIKLIFENNYGVFKVVKN
ncbi:MAG: T9SS type A sorting domain-containing protein [Bacteroidota bacterium]